LTITAVDGSVITVTITYCNEVEFTHHHSTVGDATEEYSKMLAEAIEPVGQLAESLHVRKVVLEITKNGESVHLIHSGVFECDHVA
jgi:hypothetical protein